MASTGATPFAFDPMALWHETVDRVSDAATPINRAYRSWRKAATKLVHDAEANLPPAIVESSALALEWVGRARTEVEGMIVELRDRLRLATCADVDAVMVQLRDISAQIALLERRLEKLAAAESHRAAAKRPAPRRRTVRRTAHARA
jgi:hypothetical protein